MQRHTIATLAILLLVTVLTVPSAGAQEADFDMVIVNSADGMDIYSSMLYATLLDRPSKFILSIEHGRRLIQTIDSKQVKDILLVTSRDHSYHPGFASELRTKGFVVEEIMSESGRKLNLELAERLDAKRFVGVDTTVGYNAVSAAYYAKATDAYVLMLDAGVADDVAEFLSERRPEKLLLFGYVESSVKEKLAEFNPEVLDYNDKYVNNIELLKRAEVVEPFAQVLMTDGTFIEDSIMRCDHPVLLIGTDVTPQKVAEYLIESPQIKLGVLIGDMLSSGYSISRAVNAERDFELIAKFGQGIPLMYGNRLLPLDVFPLPGYPLKMDIIDAVYNEGPEKLEVEYKNLVNAPTWFQPTIRILVDNVSVLTVGDKEPLLIEKLATMTRQYDVDKDILIGHVAAEVTIIYGEFPSSMDRLLTKVFPLMFVERNDSSSVRAERLVYYFGDETLVLTVRNNGTTPVYYKESFKLNVSGKTQEMIFKKDTTLNLDVGQSMNIEYPGTKLTWADIHDNPEVMIHFIHGESPSYMVRQSKNPVPLEAIEGASKSGAGSGGLGVLDIGSLLGNPLFYIVLTMLLLPPFIFFFLLPRRRSLRILDVVYNKRRSEFEVVVKNSKGESFEAAAMVRLFSLGGKIRVFSKKGAFKKIGPHEVRTFTSPAKLSAKDIDSAKKVEADLLYRSKGEKKERLLRKKAKLKVVGSRSR